jgi:AcrR family transcriptional regulator
MSKKAELTHDSILNAAQHVLQQHGVRGLTLDKVAKEAGVSKGGLIHHFPSKDDLLLAMLRCVSTLMTEQLDRLLLEEPDNGQKGRFLRAYMRCNLETIEQGIPSFILNLLELASVKPDIFQSQREFFAQMQAKVENDGIDPVLATILAGASDSLWLQVLFGILEPNHPQIRTVHNRLIQMTQ